MTLFKTDGTILDREFRAANPGWSKQLIGFVAVLIALMAGLEYGKAIFMDSPRAAASKRHLAQIADLLETAEKVGDQQSALNLLDQVTQDLQAYNAMDDAQKQAINLTPLRYCVLATTNLSSGIAEVIQTGRWSSRDKYENALQMCR